MDILARWCPEDVELTTFSITMIQFVSKGMLADFVRGLEAMERLQPGDKVLIVEACNHSRVNEDIGTVQIPGTIPVCGWSTTSAGNSWKMRL